MANLHALDTPVYLVNLGILYTICAPCRNGVIGINRIYSTYGNIHPVPALRHFIDELFTHG